MTTQVSSRHPLLEKKIVGIATWEEWMGRWEAVSTAEELISLLHYGFDASGNVYEKAAFYLSIADGHADWQGKYIGQRHDDVVRKYSGGMSTSLRRPGPPHEKEYTSAALRHLIAKKAWSVLCVRFFGDWAGFWRDDNSLWLRRWNHRDQDLDLLKLLFDFLDPKCGANNLSATDHHVKPFHAFMKRFITVAWDVAGLEKYSGRVKELGGILPLCKEGRPRLLNMISALDWEDMLLELKFDELMLRHLERDVHAYEEANFRHVALEVSAAVGYRPAQVAILLRNKAQLGKSSA